MAKKIEIVRQVKLTAKQRFVLVEMQNGGGRAERGMDFTVRADLRALGLIEERPRYTEAEKKKIAAEVAGQWKRAPGIVRAKNVDDLDRLCDHIRGNLRRAEEKAWWLTDAANEYLVKGRVVIER